MSYYSFYHPTEGRRLSRWHYVSAAGGVQLDLDRPKRAVITSKYYIGPLYKTAAHTLAQSKNATALLYYAARRPVLVIYS